MAAVSPVPIRRTCFLSIPVFSSAVFTAISPIDTNPSLISEDSLTRVAIRIQLSNNFSNILPTTPACFALDTASLISSRISFLPIIIESKPETSRNR